MDKFLEMMFSPDCVFKIRFENGEFIFSSVSSQIDYDRVAETTILEDLCTAPTMKGLHYLVVTNGYMDLHNGDVLQVWTVPVRGETPSEEMIDFLHGLPLEWSGDDEGLQVFNDDEVLTLPGGDKFYWSTSREKVIKC